jgi:hypothetical protein
MFVRAEKPVTLVPSRPAGILHAGGGMRRCTWSTIAALFFNGIGCVLATPTERGFGPEGSEEDAEVKGVLELVNTLSLEVLKGSVGLHQLVAQAILRHRTGPDGLAGTGDDDRIDDLDELASIDHVGPQTYAKLRDYWRRFVQGQGPWRQGLPTGAVDLSAVLVVLAVDDPGTPDLSSPPTAHAKDVVERVLCSLRGENPGRLIVQCSRDASSFRADVDVAADGSFATTAPASFDPTKDDKMLHVAGSVAADRAITLEEYRYVGIQRCAFGFGPCNPAGNWRVRWNILGAEQSEATLARQVSCPDGYPAVESVPDLQTLTACPVCTHQILHCGHATDGEPELVCINDRYTRAEAINRETVMGCGLWEPVADLDCVPYDRTVCVAPPQREPVVPDDDAIATARTGAGCLDGFQRISTCRCEGWGCEDTLVCVDGRVASGAAVVSPGYSCGLGRHAARTFYCAFDEFTICLPD